MDEPEGRVEELRDDAAILATLEEDRRWAAYAICDLEPEYRPWARYVGHMRAGTADAVVLAYAPPGFTALIACGSAGGVRRILAAAPDLPAEAFFMVRRDDLAALETRYRVEDLMAMLRMVADADTLRPAPATGAEVRPLDGADLPALVALYADRPEAVFTRPMFASGVYVGAFIDGALVAAAGTHAVSPRHGMAAIGNVFTHPEYRGRGLGTATTGALARALAARGIRDLALNVREDNHAAISVYRRLGFAAYLPFWEGTARPR